MDDEKIEEKILHLEKKYENDLKKSKDDAKLVEDMTNAEVQNKGQPNQKGEDRLEERLKEVGETLKMVMEKVKPDRVLSVLERAYYESLLLVSRSEAEKYLTSKKADVNIALSVLREEISHYESEIRKDNTTYGGLRGEINKAREERATLKEKKRSSSTKNKVLENSRCNLNAKIDEFREDKKTASDGKREDIVEVINDKLDDSYEHLDVIDELQESAIAEIDISSSGVYTVDTLKKSLRSDESYKVAEKAHNIKRKKRLEVAYKILKRISDTETMAEERKRMFIDYFGNDELLIGIFLSAHRMGLMRNATLKQDYVRPYEININQSVHEENTTKRNESQSRIGKLEKDIGEYCAKGG